MSQLSWLPALTSFAACWSCSPIADRPGQGRPAQTTGRRRSLLCLSAAAVLLLISGCASRQVLQVYPSIPRSAEAAAETEDCPPEAEGTLPGLVQNEWSDNEAARRYPTGIRRADSTKLYSGNEITVVSEGANLGEVIHRILSYTDVNYVFSPETDLQRPVYARLENLPWDHALDLLLQSADLRIIHGQLHEPLFRIDSRTVFDAEREERMRERWLWGRHPEYKAQKFTVKSLLPSDLKPVLREYLTPGGRLFRGAEEKTIIVYDSPGALAKIAEMLSRFEVE